jgi:hypothetical protein
MATHHTPYTNFLNALDKLVNAGGTFREKYAALLATMDENDRKNLEELLSWFGFELE